ncbi:hypothetical protein ACNI65_18675 [Roseateles sp. So40a]|uniref:hypothetical protein n=1 Tax=Roseateles sp. So40a TaxID=3400226 RepID=UPI003A865126
MVFNRLQSAAIVAAVSVFVTACGGGGTTESDTRASKASVSASDATSSAPSITTQPADAAVLTDGTPTFTVVASGDNLAYQWRKNGVDIPGATAASYQAPPASYTDHGAQFSVVVSNADGSVTSGAAQLTLQLSPNQAVFESQLLSPGTGSYFLHWKLNSGATQTSGANYAFSDFAVLGASPLTSGPQTTSQQGTQNMTRTLALVPQAPTRVLRNGAVVVVSGTNRISYVGADVRVDSMATDGTTVAISEIRSEYTTIPLTGALSASSADFAHFHDVFFTNASVMDTTRSYADGASYTTFKQTNKSDRYNVFDCYAATTDANVSACRTSTTLTAAMTAGIVSNSDGTTYKLADGAIRTVDGVSVWVATNPRPVSATMSSTVQYRVYFERNGNVYTGALVKDGAVLGGGAYLSNPNGATVADRYTFLPFDVRMNKAARDSLAAAMKL